MIPITTKRWVFTTAKTNFLMEDVDATHAMVVYFVIATCAKSNTGNVAADIGLATATLPTIVNDNATGGLGIAFTHGGIASGGGAVANLGGAPLVIGAAGEDLRVTCSAATGGDVRFTVGYQMLNLAES
jgi:hypothetical protein